MQRRTLLQAGVASTLLAGCEREHRMTSVRQVEMCLQRIATIDKAGPAINAVIELNPVALDIARRLDRGKPRSPLHGVPILIKDNIDTADRMQTTAGSLALLDSKPQRDAFLVELLRAKGMVLLGKTNLSEWANIRSPQSTSGWSARGGLTRNPHKLDHNASGSSSGSAAAVAAGLARIAIGTETNGSIISPASACGIVGLKPTVGLVSRTGIIPITHWQDTAGPMTQNVRDAALLLNIIGGEDAADPGTRNCRLPNLTYQFHSEALVGKRLGVVRSLAGSHPGVQALFEETLQKMRDVGASIIDPVELPHAEELGRHSFPAMLAEFRTDLNAYLSARGGSIRSLTDLIAYNVKNHEQEMPHFAQEFFEHAEKLGTTELQEMATKSRATARELAGPKGIDAALERHKLHALICPTNDPVHKTDLAKGDSRVRVCSTPAAVAGYPHLTVPMGLVDGLPVGLSFFSHVWSEATLLAMGDAFERHIYSYREPAYLPG